MSSKPISWIDKLSDKTAFMKTRFTRNEKRRFDLISIDTITCDSGWVVLFPQISPVAS